MDNVKFKLKIHSVVEIITNSSTVIYSYQASSVEPAKELIQEILKAFGEDREVDQLFEIDFEVEDSSPEWSCCGNETSLIIEAKEERFQPIARRLVAFLNSPTHEAEYNG